MAFDFNIKQGDEGDDLEFTLTDRNGAVNLTNALSILIYVYDSAGAPVIDGGTCVVVSALAGQAKYVIQAALTANPGEFVVNVKATFADGTIASWPSKKWATLKVWDYNNA